MNKLLKIQLGNVLRDKTTNNLIVGLLIAFSFSSLLFSAFNFGFGGGGSNLSFWWSMTWRQLAAFGLTLVVAELVSRLARR